MGGLSGLAGRLKRGNGRSVDSARVAGQTDEENGRRLAQSKGLANRAPGEGGATFSGLAGRLKRGDVDLLIPQGFLAKLLGRTDEGLLNLKGLLNVFLPSLKRWFENQLILRPLFCAESNQILSFSAKNVQKIAEKGSSRERFWEGASSLRGMSSCE